MKGKLVERQTIATWHTPEEAVPPDGEIFLVTVSGTDKNITYDHAFALAEYWHDEGWLFHNVSREADLTVLAWSNIEPYGG